jgi:hypothetical protein
MLDTASTTRIPGLGSGCSASAGACTLAGGSITLALRGIHPLPATRCPRGRLS